jgi:hypothetical protein
MYLPEGMSDGCLTLKKVNDAHDGDIKVCSFERKKSCLILYYIVNRTHTVNTELCQCSKGIYGTRINKEVHTLLLLLELTPHSQIIAQ